MEAPVQHVEVIDKIAYIKGRKLKVKMIAGMYIHAGASIEQIAEQYHLTVADVHAALAYYYDHQEILEKEEHELDVLIENAQKESEIRLERMREAAQQKRRTS